MVSHLANIVVPMGYGAFGAGALLAPGEYKKYKEEESKIGKVATGIFKGALIGGLAVGAAITTKDLLCFAWSSIPEGTGAAIIGGIRSFGAWVSANLANAHASYLALPAVVQVAVPVTIVAVGVAAIAIPRLISWAKAKKAEGKELPDAQQTVNQPPRPEPISSSSSKDEA